MEAQSDLGNGSSATTADEIERKTTEDRHEDYELKPTDTWDTEEQKIGEKENDVEKQLSRSQSSGQPIPPNQANLHHTTTALDWEGPTDPDNPWNWSLWKRTYYAASPAGLAFTVSIASSIITPGVVEIEKEFNVSRTAAILTLSLYVSGLGFGPTVAAGPSETYGRSIVYKTSVLSFMSFTLGAGFSHNFGSSSVTRFFAGFFGGPVSAVGSGTLADVFPPHLRAVSQGSFVLAPFAGPALGPVIGGFASQYKGWRWTQWSTSFIALPSYLFALPMSETYKRIILERRGQRLGLEYPPKLGPKGFLPGLRFLLTVTVARPLLMSFTEPLVGIYSTYTAFTFSVLFAFFGAFPYVYESVYGFSVSQYGLTFLAIGLGVSSASSTSIVLDRVLYQPKRRQLSQQGRTSVEPEHRLYTAMVGSFGVPIGIFWFAWTAKSDVHWIVPVLAGIPFGWGNSCIFTSCLLYLTDVYGPLLGASAAAANGIARYTLGAVFPLFTFQMYQRSGIGWATSLLGFVSVVMLPIPWVFFKWGPKIRARSRYDTIKA